MSKVALLIIDMQEGLREETSCKELFDNALMYINEVSQFFRNKSLPVVIVQDLSVGAPNSEAFQCTKNLIVNDSDYRIQKKYNNAFWETELDELLKGEDVDAVVICGFAAEYCVLFSYNGALERGYETFLLQKGIAGYSESGIDQIQLLRSVISYQAVEYFLKERN